VPPASPGVLYADITDVAVTFLTNGHNIGDYPASGTVRINDEVITYSAIVDNGDGTFTWTVASRQTDGSAPDEHSLGDTVQLCRRYTNARIDDVLVALIGDDAGVEYQYLDTVGWTQEYDTYLSAYTLTTLIAEPTAVADLLAEICEQCSLYMWWDERDQRVRMQAIHPLNVAPQIYDDVNHFVEDSVRFREKPEERITQVWMFYNQATRTETLDNKTNYHNVYIDTDLTLEADEKYGQPAVREIFSRWLTTEAQVAQTTSRLITRYQDVPVEITFRLDAKDRDLWVGDVIGVRHFRLRTQYGKRDQNRVFIVTSAREIVPGELMEYTAEDATLAGFIYTIAPNSQGDHTGGADDALYGFITDNNGLYGDGTPGAKVS
jgi:hypothetical protein